MLLRAAAIAITLGVAALAPRVLHAQPVDACILANENAQDLERAGSRRAARARALSCTTNCPAQIAADCTLLAERIGTMIPTVIFGARSGSRDLVDVTVTIDGEVLATRLEGTPIVVDPGPRKVVLTAPGYAPTELQLVFRATEKNRLVTAELAPAPSKPPDDLAPKTPPADATGSGGWSPPALFFVLGGVSVASFVVTGVTGGLALSERGELDACIATKTCAQDDIDAVETKALVSDVFLGVGGAFAVGAILTLVLWPEEEPAAKPAVTAGPGGGFVGVAGSF